jgi:superfamily II DNA/RNA helicase
VPSSFADLGVAPDAVSDLAARGIHTPFPIQAATLLDALAGRDVAGKAPTGSGKTLAFGLAIVARCPRAKPRRPTALVLVPTRELAGQVARELTLLARPHRLRVATVYGGVGFGPQRKALRDGVDILVACPGRLADLIGQGDVRLDAVAIAVIDEADRMADMGFLPEVRKLLDQIHPERQTLLYSATLDGAVDVLVRRYQRDPVRHEVDGDEGSAIEATHLFWRITEPDRLDQCAEVVRSAGPTIVFCRTRHRADRVAKRLGSSGIDAVAIHGGRSQGQRDRALRDFTTGRAAALVATDVAARGIHVDDVAAVVHFDLPADPKDYVHRSGRTARAGADGLVVSLVADQHRKDARRLQKAVGLPDGLTDPDVRHLRTRLSEAPHGRPNRPRRRRRR